MDNKNWSEGLADKAIKVERLNKFAVGNTRQDMTRPILEDLLDQGYSVVTWDSGRSRHSICVDLDRQTWPLDRFLQGLQHDAPLFERSHPGDISCSLVVSGDGLPDMRVDSYGNVNESTRGPVRPKFKKRTPKRVQQVPLRKPKPKVEQKRVKPEEKKKYQYVPKKQWEQIKEQPSQHDIEQKQKEEDLEDWLSTLERETSLNKARKILKGITEK